MKKSKILAVFVPTLLIICFVYFICEEDYYEKKVQKEGIYSIATIESVQGGRGGLHYNCSFFFKGKRIISRGSKGVYMSDIGKRYFVKFLGENPSGYFILLTEQVVPSSIQEAPYEGWTSLPEYRTE